MLEKFEITIPQLTGKKYMRRLYVWTPDGADAEQRFPVLYMFDGHNVFLDDDATYGKSWGMKEYLEKTGTPVIVVGVECSHTTRSSRICEYSPFSFYDSEFGMIHARGKLTMEWFVNELKPWVDSHYPTMPEREHTWISGSSMGGLMSLYAATVYNGVFGRAAALSPSIELVPKRLMKLVREAEVTPDTVIYMDYGQREFDGQPGVRREFGALTGLLLEKGVNLTSRIVPNGEHCEASWQAQLPVFMNVLTCERE